MGGLHIGGEIELRCRVGVIGLRILIGKEFCSGWGCD
jgi:hypothetical protein